ncbi:hypothetical protein N7453_001904 [Penicillium expansum]|nr:hypothetical protein N7453_001904 [Penicillium expansum]
MFHNLRRSVEIISKVEGRCSVVAGKLLGPGQPCPHYVDRSDFPGNILPGDGPRSSYYYTSCAEESLDIKFKEMFCRPPAALEHNIQISVDWLERIASII